MATGTARGKQPKSEESENPKPEALNIDERNVRDSEQQKLSTQDMAILSAYKNVITIRALNQPETRAAQTIQMYQDRSADINVLIHELRKQIADTKNGGMSQQEAMLIAQAHTLDALFNSLARRAHADMCGSHLLDAADRYLRLAFKAQAQAVRTIEALGNLKNPRISYVNQANIANGPQQVNNVIPRAEENQNQPNELSGRTPYELCQDTPTPSPAGRTDPGLEAVGAIHRAKNGER